MARTNIALLTLTVAAAAALTARRFVSPTGAVATAASNALGVARSDAAIGQDTPVDVLGTAIVESEAAIAAGSLVQVGATGKAVIKSAGVTVGRLAPGSVSTAPGQLVEVILIPN